MALIAVFMPIIFLQGLTGRLFKEFGVVIGGSVAISAFIALTLTPMLSTRLIKSHQGHTWFYQRTEPFFAALNEGYRNSLDTFLRRRWLGFAAMLAATGLAWLFFAVLPQELAPLEDRSRLRVNSTAPEGTSFERMEKYMDRLVDLIKAEVPEA